MARRVVDSVAFDHVTILDFDSLEDLRAFLRHPAHLRAVEGIFRDVVEEGVIANYELPEADASPGREG